MNNYCTLHGYWQHTTAVTDCPSCTLAELEHGNHGHDQFGKSAGLAIAKLLDLKSNEIGRYQTAWGSKTPLGLYHTVKRVIEEGEA